MLRVEMNRRQETHLPARDRLWSWKIEAGCGEDKHATRGKEGWLRRRKYALDSHSGNRDTDTGTDDNSDTPGEPGTVLNRERRRTRTQSSSFSLSARDSIPLMFNGFLSDVRSVANE